MYDFFLQLFQVTCTKHEHTICLDRRQDVFFLINSLLGLYEKIVRKNLFKKNYSKNIYTNSNISE